MAGPLRRTPRDPKAKPAPAAAPVPTPSVWTEAKIGAVLAALNTFVHNQARKHGITPAEVWALVRDEALDPDGRH